MQSLNRVVIQKASRDWIRGLGPKNWTRRKSRRAGGEQFGFRSCRRFQFPDHDPCQGPFRDADGKVPKFDLILANQVWEHVDRPHAATRHVW